MNQHRWLLRTWLSESGANHSRKSVFIFLAVAVVVGKLPMLFGENWGFDDLWWVMIGRVMAEGGDLYRSGFDTKPPLFLGLFWIAHLIVPSNGHLGAVILCMVFMFCTAVTIYLVADALFDRVTASLSSVFFIIMSLSFKSLTTQNLQAEQFVLLPVALSILLYVRSLRSHPPVAMPPGIARKNPPGSPRIL